MEKSINKFSVILKKPQFLMPAVLLAWGLFYFFWGGIINVNNGFGYDGVIYGNLTKNFYEQVFGNNLSFYRIQRIFPSFAVDSILRILHLPKKTLYIIKAFQLYNLFLLMICSFLWYKIAVYHKLTYKYIWIGFILGFLNFGIAEFTFYYPVLTDTTAFFLGFCLLYFHLKNNISAKIIVTVIGAFTWPVLIYTGILLIIFPVNVKLNFNDPENKTFTPKNYFFPAALSLPFLITSVWFINNYFQTGVFSEVDTQIYDMFLYLSAVVNFILLSYWLSRILPATSSLYKFTGFIFDSLKQVRINNVLISLAIFILIFSVQKYLSNNSVSDGGSLWKVFYFISVYSVTKPLSFIVTSVTYFGPCFVLLFCYLKKYQVYIYDLGAGVLTSFVVSFLIIFTTEVRLITHFFPFIILSTVLVLNDIGLNKKRIITLSAFSFVLSKVFIPMFNIPGNPVNMFYFPDQFLFMNLFTVSKESYIIQGIVILVFSFFLLKIFYGKNIKSNE